MSDIRIAGTRIYCNTQDNSPETNYVGTKMNVMGPKMSVRGPKLSVMSPEKSVTRPKISVTGSNMSVVGSKNKRQGSQDERSGFQNERYTPCNTTIQDNTPPPNRGGAQHNESDVLGKISSRCICP